MGLAIQVFQQKYSTFFKMTFPLKQSGNHLGKDFDFMLFKLEKFSFRTFQLSQQVCSHHLCGVFCSIPEHGSHPRYFTLGWLVYESKYTAKKQTKNPPDCSIHPVSGVYTLCQSLRTHPSVISLSPLGSCVEIYKSGREKTVLQAKWL